MLPCCNKENSMRRRRHVSFFLMLLLLTVLVGCSSVTPSMPQSTTLTKGSPVLTTVPTPPFSPASPAPMPKNCSVTPPPGTRVFPAGWGGYQVNTTLIGRSPVWTDMPTDSHVQLNSATQDTPVPSPGPKILWEVGPNFTHPITVVVKNVATGELAGWGNGQQASSASTFQLERTNPEFHGSPVEKWNEWGSVLYLLPSGCYSMKVSWPGGEWHIVFATGK